MDQTQSRLGYMVEAISFTARETRVVWTMPFARNDVLRTIYQSMQRLGHTSGLVNREFGLLIGKPPFSLISAGRRMTYSLSETDEGTRVEAIYTHGLLSLQSRHTRQALLETVLRSALMTLQAEEEAKAALKDKKGTPEAPRPAPQAPPVAKKSAPEPPRGTQKPAPQRARMTAKTAPSSAKKDTNAPSPRQPKPDVPKPGMKKEPSTQTQPVLDASAKAFISQTQAIRRKSSWSLVAKVMWFIIGVGLMALIIALISAFQS